MDDSPVKDFALAILVIAVVCLVAYAHFHQRDRITDLEREVASLRGQLDDARRERDAMAMRKPAAVPQPWIHQRLNGLSGSALDQKPVKESPQMVRKR